MNLRRVWSVTRTTIRAVWAPVLFACLVLGAAAPAEAQILPPGFFDMHVSASAGGAAVEADRLSYDQKKGTVSAEGNVLLSYQGYTIRADSIVYDQSSGELHAVGNVVVRDPMNSVYHTEKLDVTDEMKKAFLASMTLDMPDGSKVTADSANYDQALTTILTQASYSPCGLCVDSKGRRIGWKISAARMIYDKNNASLTFDQPSLQLLGIPVLWLPWFWIPDPSQPRASGMRLPSVGGDANRGLILGVPYFVPVGDDVDVLLTPTLMSRQGFLMRGDVTWRIPPVNGEINVSASGLYQLDPSAFGTSVGNRQWRGAIQTYGRFTPIKDWTVGWTYSTFSDNQYLYDYGSAAKNDSAVNQLYGTNLTADTYIDARLQHFNLIGNTATDDPAQANLLPVVKFSHIQDLADGYGRISVNGKLLSIVRGADQSGVFNGVPYVSGYEGNKQHLEIEGAYENQWILPGGVAATPYLGVRLDATRYDRTIVGAPPIPAPADTNLLEATPIAAMDIRWPLMARNGDDTHVLEPIVQLVYRGASDSIPGVINDDAQSFVFDTSNLFSYNKFSGIDRQETGLNANVGAHYLATMADGSWLDLVAGESFHLLGPNAMATPDSVQVGTSTGLGSTASYLVASATGSTANGITGNAKLQVDPNTWKLTRAGGSVGYAGPWYSAGLSYIYLPKNPALGTTADEHEVAVNGSVTLFDYYTLNAAYAHNIFTNSWASVSGGVTYDDRYLKISGAASMTPTSYGFTVHLGLKSTFGEVGF